MKKQFLIIVIALAMTGMVFAGGGSESGSGDKPTIGVIIETFDDVFMQGVKDEVEKTATSLDVNVQVLDSKSDANEQIRLVENLITNKVDAIIIHVMGGISSTITQKAIDADIPLVYMNRAPDAEDGPLPAGKKVAVVASPEIEAGKGQAKFVVDTLAAKGVTAGNVVILLGALGSSPQIGRTTGVKDYLAANAPEFTVIREQTANWKRPEGVAVIENWIASGDEFVAVFANNDEMALGASLALKEAGLRESVLIVGVDANADAVVAIGAGDMDMSMFQDGRGQGRGSVEVAVKMLNGETYDQQVDIPFQPVTKDNYQDYQ